MNGRAQQQTIALLGPDLFKSFKCLHQGFPGDIGPPGHNGLEGPKVRSVYYYLLSTVGEGTQLTCVI